MFTNSTSALKFSPGIGDDRRKYWLPVSLDRTGEHVDSEIIQKMVCHQSQRGKCSCELQVSRNLIHSSIQPRRAREGALVKVVTGRQQIQAAGNGHLALSDPIRGSTERVSADGQSVFLTNM